MSGERQFASVLLRELRTERDGREGFFNQAEDEAFSWAQQDVTAHRCRTSDKHQPVAVALFGDFNIIRELWRVCAVIAFHYRLLL